MVNIVKAYSPHVSLGMYHNFRAHWLWQMAQEILDNYHQGKPCGYVDKPREWISLIFFFLGFVHFHLGTSKLLKISCVHWIRVMLVAIICWIYVQNSKHVCWKWSRDQETWHFIVMKVMSVTWSSTNFISRRHKLCKLSLGTSLSHRFYIYKHRSFFFFVVIQFCFLIHFPPYYFGHYLAPFGGLNLKFLCLNLILW